MNTETGITIHEVQVDTFERFDEVLELLRQSFAYMDGRIDPPSSLHRIDLLALIEKARQETVFVAVFGKQIVGCVFASRQEECIYLGKLAVSDAYRGRGIARCLIECVENIAAQSSTRCVDIETRVELTENQRLFEHLGYVRWAENSHEGYTRTTSIRYRKPL
ncbi:MAG: GNAT family N-acetyltransferase [Pseudomonadota bacterium]